MSWLCKYWSLNHGMWLNHGEGNANLCHPPGPPQKDWARCQDQLDSLFLPLIRSFNHAPISICSTFEPWHPWVWWAFNFLFKHLFTKESCLFTPSWDHPAFSITYLLRESSFTIESHFHSLFFCSRLECLLGRSTEWLLSWYVFSVSSQVRVSWVCRLAFLPWILSSSESHRIMVGKYQAGANSQCNSHGFHTVALWPWTSYRIFLCLFLCT